MNKEVMIVAGVIVVLMLLGVSFLFLALLTGEMMWIASFVSCGASLLFLIVGGLTTVPEEKRYLVEIMGKYYGTLYPGLQWICPLFMKVRGEVSIWEQSIELFREVIKIDFRDGSAILKGVTAFLKVKNPDVAYEVEEFPSSLGDLATGVYRLIYLVDDWRERVRELLENAVRSYLSGLGLDDALKEGRGGYNLIEKGKIPSTEVDGLQAKLASWGLDLTKLTIEDFDLDPKVIAAREAVQEAKRKAEAAEYEVLTRAQETVGALIQMRAQATGKKVADVQQEISGDPERMQKLDDLSMELVTRQMSIDGKCLTDVRVGQGGDPVRQLFIELIAAWKSTSSKQ